MFFYLQMIETDADRDKFAALYDRHRKKMFFMAYEILENQDDAEDAVHQAFLAVIENLDKVGDVDSSETFAYLMIIVERKAIDIHRARRFLSFEEFDESFYTVEYPFPGDLGLEILLSGLSPLRRDLLLLRYGCGYSIREIAELLDQNYDAVQKDLVRARKDLWARIQQAEST